MLGATEENNDTPESIQAACGTKFETKTSQTQGEVSTYWKATPEARLGASWRYVTSLTAASTERPDVCDQLHSNKQQRVARDSDLHRNFVGGVQQIRSRTEDREKGDLGAVAPYSGVLEAA